MSSLKFSKATGLLHKGNRLRELGFQPEVVPIFLNTAFSNDNLTKIKQQYDNKDYTYIRTRNPNRDMLAEALSYLEGGEATLIMSSGMGAITSTLLTLLQPGDHVLCNDSIYGETFDVMHQVLNKFGIDTDLIPLADLDLVESKIKPNTKMIYSEVTSNPTMALVDVDALGKIAHTHDMYLMVDNTFTTPMAICPIELGADIVVNSLTKYVSGHGDAIGGSVTASQKIIDAVKPMSQLYGTPGDPFDSWLILRGLYTIDLRVKKQMENAAVLAKALSANPCVQKVNHPSLESFPQRELAKKMFTGNLISGMMSIIVPEYMEKFDAFVEKLQLCHYAMTLGGVRTTLTHPCTSSHSHMPDDARRKMGVTPGMFRLSIGTEEVEDLIADFNQALTVFA